MTFAHVYNEIQMKITQVKTHKLYIIKKRSNNKVSFVEFILNSLGITLKGTYSQLSNDHRESAFLFQRLSVLIH